jgi:hypothetical protein
MIKKWLLPMNLFLVTNFDLMYFSGMKVDKLLDDQFN